MADVSEKNQGNDQKPARPGAIDNLDVLEQEAGANDVAVAEAVTQSDADAINARQAELAKQKAAELGASTAIGFCNGILMMTKPVAVMTPEERAMLEKPLAAYIAKNDGEPPEWYVENKELCDLLGAAAIVGFGMYMRVQASKAQEPDASNQNCKVNPNTGTAPAATPQAVVVPIRDSLDPNAPPL